MLVKDTTLKAFMDLFRGRTDAWGSVEGRSNKETVTPEHYRKHLTGERSMGCYMLLDTALGPDGKELDTGTCWFFAVDIDVKKFELALGVQQGFAKRNIPVYIAESKGKGFHVYGFGSEALPAKHVRNLCYAVLGDQNLTAEVFPKQDKLDKKVTPLGNYINLPCHGFTRLFQTSEYKPVDTELAMATIKRISLADLMAVVKTLPPPVTPFVEKKEHKATTTTASSGKKLHPPCIERILRGVGEGQRDVAAFALARHFLDQLFLPEEIIGLLIEWDKHNHPPLEDARLLETKARSATRGGYAFGCSSITKEPLLKDFCVGETQCTWLKKIVAERKKQGLIQDTSFYETDTHLYEEIIQPADGVTRKKPMFLKYDKKTGEMTTIPSIDLPEVTLIPAYGPEVTEGAVTMPTGIEEYGSTMDLVAELKAHIHDYVDVDPLTEEFCTWYIMMSWIYDKLSTVSYLRLRGDTGTGKSRTLDVVGKLCYKPMMMAGAVTPAPIYRLIRRFRGTIILEEADLGDSDEKNEVVKVLNCGFERFRPVIRCLADNPDTLEVLPVFGPKAMASRFEFQDAALEARCLTFVMRETTRLDIPPILGDRFYEKAAKIRNKLLLYRLRNYQLITSEMVEDINLGNIEPRLKQLGLPFAVSFKNLPDVLARFKEFLREYQLELKRVRLDTITGKVLQAFFKLALDNDKSHITSTMIHNYMQGDMKMEKLSVSTVARQLKSLKITTSNRRGVGTRANFINWDDNLMTNLMKLQLEPGQTPPPVQSNIVDPEPDQPSPEVEATVDTDF
jgi:hypothetical protein